MTLECKIYGGVFDIAKKEKEIEEKQAITEQADFWADSKKAEKLLKELAGIKDIVSSYNEVKASFDDLSVLKEFYDLKEADEQELNAQILLTQKKIEDLEFKKMLGNEEDKLSCMLTINAGAGGTESCDWVAMLMRMYLRWAELSDAGFYHG